MRLREDQQPIWGWERAHLDRNLEWCRGVAKVRRYWRQAGLAAQALRSKVRQSSRRWHRPALQQTINFEQQPALVSETYLLAVGQD